MPASRIVNGSVEASSAALNGHHLVPSSSTISQKRYTCTVRLCLPRPSLLSPWRPLPTPDYADDIEGLYSSRAEY